MRGERKNQLKLKDMLLNKKSREIIKKLRTEKTDLSCEDYLINSSSRFFCF